MPQPGAARRLPPTERRDQLIDIARDLLARDGYARLSLDELAERAGVTRNLLYRYFPRGRLDLYLEVLDDVMVVLAEGLITDPGMTMPERRVANLARMSEHALGRTPEWAIYSDSLGLREPEVSSLLDDFHHRWASLVAQNNGVAGTPTMISALIAFRAAGMKLFEEASRLGHDPKWVRSVLSVLLDTVLATDGPPIPRAATRTTRSLAQTRKSRTRRDASRGTRWE